jgi:hypothetical protein
MMKFKVLLPLLSGIGVAVMATLPLFSQVKATRTLQASGHFEYSFVDGSRLEQMAAADSKLYVLVRSRVNGELIRFDSLGRVLDHALVHRRTSQFAVGPDGTVMTLRQEGSKSIISGPFFDTSQPSTEMKMVEPIERLTILAGSPIGLTSSGASLGIVSGRKERIPINVISPYRTLPLPDGSLAIIASRQPTLWKLDATGHLSSAVTLTAPDLMHFQPTDTNLAVIDVATHQSGDFILATSPYNSAEGARIVRFDRFGHFKFGLRLLMPQFPEISSATDGRLSVGKIAMIRNRLFIGSSTATALRIAYFDLDR